MSVANLTKSNDVENTKYMTQRDLYNLVGPANQSYIVRTEVCRHVDKGIHVMSLGVAPVSKNDVCLNVHI
jgi:hypothetical protein